MCAGFIADTGIATQRDAIKEKEEGASLKSKTRERVQPKMGKIDIDYQKLHDAFFKFQTKPKMTEFGETYVFDPSLLLLLLLIAHSRETLAHTATTKAKNSKLS